MVIRTNIQKPREFYIKKADAEKHGYTRGCGGCSSWFKGLGRQPHSKRCRERFEAILKDEARVKHSQERKRKYEEEIEEKKWRKLLRRDERRLKEEEEAEERKKAEQNNEDYEDEENQESGKRKVDEEAEEEENSVNNKRTRLAAVEKWVCEIREAVEEENEAEEKRWNEDYEDEEIGWDDVRGGVLRAADVAAARAEEIKYMVERRRFEDGGGVLEEDRKGPQDGEVGGYE